MLGEQSPESRGGGRPRGIARYTQDLLKHLLALGARHEFVLYYHEGLYNDEPPQEAHVAVRLLPSQSVGRTRSEASQALVDANPDQLDLLLFTSPMDFIAPAPSKGHSKLLLAAIVYDLIPGIFQEHYLTHYDTARRYYRALRNLQQYDLLLSISEATRADFLRLMAIDPRRIVNISTASDSNFFEPPASQVLSAADQETLRGLAVQPPFIFHLGGMDDRKNVRGLIRAFSLLAPALKRTHQLVATYAMTPGEVESIRSFAREQGVHRQLVLTNAVSDEVLRVFYQRCAAFAFPSRYEGFGLPILEAMLCGAPVVAGANSSQIEVVGNAGLLAHSDDLPDIAAKLTRVLTDQPLAKELRQRAVVQAARFNWDITAQRALDAMKSAGATSGVLAVKPVRNGIAAANPRIAFFSPFPPKASGISDYSMHLLQSLKRHYTIDLYHEPGYQPDVSFASSEFACRDYRAFPRFDAALQYHNVVYQMGNSSYHRFVYEMLLGFPGIVVLHDFFLAGFHNWYSRQPGVPADHFDRELRHSSPELFNEYATSRAAWERESGGLPRACTRRGIAMNRRIIERATRLVLHDTWGRDMIRQHFPEHIERTGVIPHGAGLCVLDAAERAAVRERFSLSPQALVISSLGIVSMTKMNLEAVEAFAAIAPEFPQAVFLLVGSDADYPDVRARVAALGIESRVRFLGRQPIEDFVALAGITDIGINLRRPPTNGETSGSLLTFLGAGVATIVNNVDAFGSYPATVVRRIDWDAFGVRSLQSALQELARDRRLREEYGRNACEYVRQHHDWDRVAQRYATLIDDSAAARTRHASGLPPAARPMSMAA
jgi:glycosyltransferase involved in cell wall biosynthesis